MLLNSCRVTISESGVAAYFLAQLTGPEVAHLALVTHDF